MIIVRIPRESRFASYIVEKYRRSMEQGLVLGDIARSDTAVYFISPDEALSAAFLYSVYLKAKEKGLDAEAMYATRVDLDAVLPEDVKKVGIVWLSGRPSKNEIASLKNKFITPNLLEVILR